VRNPLSKSKVPRFLFFSLSSPDVEGPTRRRRMETHEQLHPSKHNNAKVNDSAVFPGKNGRRTAWVKGFREKCVLREVSQRFVEVFVQPKVTTRTRKWTALVCGTQVKFGRILRTKMRLEHQFKFVARNS
jgi:hypothetical protein